jgi:putative SOS response-associated peptidase YedK
MCNLYSQSTSADAIRALASAMGMQLQFPEGIPNLQPRDIAITDQGPIVRAAQPGNYDLIVRRWSWPGPGGKPVYNFRSDGRDFPAGRCLILTDGFYEFTQPVDPKQKRKDRWLFTDPEVGVLGIAGIVRDVPGIGEAFTMLTTEPGPDVAPYHNRQVAALRPSDWQGWLDYSSPAQAIIRPLPGGSLSVQPANRAG